jgi:hypothetical protein
MAQRARGVNHGANLVTMSRFGGMVTDIDPTHLQSNRFQQLINYKVENGELHKILGYRKYHDNQFNYPLSNISQLIRYKDDGSESFLFCFNREGLWYRDATGVFQFLSSRVDDLLESVRTISFQNRLWCVDPNVFPFYISKDEASYDLNIWATLKVSGTSVVQIVDINDNTLVYDTSITIDPQAVDGQLTVEYNDGNYIYIRNNSWIFKFDYGNQVFDIVNYKKITPSSAYNINDVSYKSNSFGIIFLDSSTGTYKTKEFNYNFDEIIVGNRVSWLWKSIAFDFKHEVKTKDNYGKGYAVYEYGYISPTGSYGLFFAQEQRFNVMSENYFSISITDVHGENKQVSLTEFDDYDMDYFDETYRFPGIPISPGGHGPVENSRSYYKAYLKRYTHSRRTMFFRKSNKLYVGMSTKANYDIEARNLVVAIQSDGFQTVVGDAHNPFENRSIDKDTVRVYDLNNEFNDITVAETIQDLEDMITNNEYDQMIMNYTYDDNTPIVLVNIEDDLYNDWNYPPTSTHFDATPYRTSIYPAKPPVPNGIFYVKLSEQENQQNPEDFYPYENEYVTNEWSVRAIGTPGKPYAVEMAGSITGRYVFYSTYITDLNGESESEPSPYSNEVNLTNRGVRIFWAVIPSEYPNSILRLRLFAHDLDNPTSNDICIADMVKDGDDWNAGYKEITVLTPIESFFNKYSIVPKCHLITNYLNRLCLIPVAEPNQILYSDALVPDSFPSENALQVKPDDNDSIVGWAPIYDRLYVFKNESIYALVGDLGGAQLIQLDTSKKYGCISSDSIVVYKNTVIFLSKLGLCLLSGNQIVEISKGIFNNYIFGFSTEEIKKARGKFDITNKTYRLYISDKVIVTDTNGQYWVEDKVDGDSYTTIGEVFENNETKLLFSNFNNFIYQEKIGKFFDNRKRWAYLMTKIYKFSDLKDGQAFNSVKLNALLNDNMVIQSTDRRYCQNIEPTIKNYYEVYAGNVLSEDMSFELFESSPYDNRIFDLHISYD